jgi:formyltetrahydrofolate synthetase
MTEPLFDIDVELSGTDGNAMSIMAKVRRAILNAGGSKDDAQRYLTDAMSGDYDNVLRTTMKYVRVS